MINLTMFQAGKGDFFLLMYGEGSDIHYILIDGGEKTASSLYKKTLLSIKNKKQPVDAIIFTHIDNDHIMGALQALMDMSVDDLPTIHAVYFNTGDAVCQIEGVKAKERPEDLPLVRGRTGQHSVKKAISLLQLLELKGLKKVLKEYTIQGERIILKGGAELDIISPGRDELEKFILKWDKEIELSDKKGGRQHKSVGVAEAESTKDIDDFLYHIYVEDSSVTNRSSIAFLFQYESVKIAFLGDASPSVCVEGIKQFFPEGVNVDLIKLSHHGSGANISNEMLNVIRSDHYMLSTTGEKLSKYLWARLIKYERKAVVHCNYDWWKRIYCHAYFSEKDVEKYIRTGKLEVGLIAYEGEEVKDGLWIFRNLQI